jgi:hypothetical protein
MGDQLPLQYLLVLHALVHHHMNSQVCCLLAYIPVQMQLVLHLTE